MGNVDYKETTIDKFIRLLDVYRSDIEQAVYNNADYKILHSERTELIEIYSNVIKKLEEQQLELEYYGAREQDRYLQEPLEEYK